MSKIFVSYSHLDDRKKQLLEELLRLNNFEPIIVTSRDRPSNLLSDKVKEALNEADFLIPILTKNSVFNQWVNQEIGYAKRLLDEKQIEIYPIVEKGIMVELKQFINNQQDLPYHFNENISKGVENKAFKKQCQRLIEFLNKKHKKPKPKALKQIPKAKKTNRNINLETFFTHLSLRQLNSDNKIELNSSITIESKGNRSFAINEIEITIPYVHYNIKSELKETLTFKSSYYTLDGSNRQFLTHNPIIIQNKEIKHIYKLFFISKESIFTDQYIDRNNYREYFIQNLKLLNTVEVTFYLQNGRKLTSIVSVSRKS